MKFRKKPIEVEAVRFERGSRDWPSGVCVSNSIFKGEPFVHTLNGQVRVQDGDFIVKGPLGEYYPVNPQAFARLYEKVEEETNA